MGKLLILSLLLLCAMMFAGHKFQFSIIEVVLGHYQNKIAMSHQAKVFLLLMFLKILFNAKAMDNLSSI